MRVQVVMRPRAPVVLLALALLAGACGTDASRRDAERLVDRFQAAIAGSDGGSACEQLSEELRSSLERSEGKPCEQAVLGLGLAGGGRAQDGRAYVTAALVRVPGRGTAFLDETEAGWRIDAAGCEPSGERDAYDCLLQD
jgi:hypothetical protein